VLADELDAAEEEEVAYAQQLPVAEVHLRVLGSGSTMRGKEEAFPLNLNLMFISAKKCKKKYKFFGVSLFSLKICV
jgi:hypothetical protein